MLTEEKIIEQNNGNLTLITLGSLPFIVLGIWVLTMDAAKMQTLPLFPIMKTQGFLLFAGSVNVVFFAGCFIAGCYKMYNKIPGVVLNKEGFTENISVASIGFVPWSDVEEIGVYKEGFQVFGGVSPRTRYCQGLKGTDKKKLAQEVKGAVKLFETPGDTEY